MNSKLANLEWHDGILRDMKLGVDKKGQATFTLLAELYADSQSPARRTCQIVCRNIKQLNLNIDGEELKENYKAGFICAGGIKNNLLWLSLYGGMVQITAQQFSVKRAAKQ